MALQHLRSSTANKRPTPAAMSDGQLAMNTNLASPGLFLKDSNGDSVKVGPVHVGTTAPNATPAAGGQAGNSVGEQWLDISSSRYVFKIWDGTAWRTQDGEFVNVSGDTMTGALGIIAGSSATPGVFFSGDTNTGIYSPGANQLAVATNGTEHLRVDSAGKLLVGATVGDVSITAGIQIAGTNFGGTQLITRYADTNSSDSAQLALLRTRGSTSSSRTIVSNGDELGELGFSGTDGSGISQAASISVSVDGTPGLNDMPGRLVFATTADGAASSTERLRITSAGNVGIGTSAPAAKTEIATNTNGDGLRISYANTPSQGDGAALTFALYNNAGTLIPLASVKGIMISGGVGGEAGGLTFNTSTGGAAPAERMRIDSTGVFFVGTTAGQPNPGFVVNPAGFNKIGNNAGTNGWGFYDFVRSGVSIGSITQTGTTGVAYNTSSDYRLKENVTPVTDGITRLQQLNPSRFNFIADPNRTVDGFIAHEAQAVVPECVTGEKDAVDDDGNLVYQGIDQSKLVPLLTAALQEAIGKIETLEARLTAAGIE